jgi:plasmid stabilization system protein ParE
MRLVWSPRALRDVERVYRFLADTHPGAAKRAASAIRKGVSPLREYPQMGRVVPDMPAGFREWLVPFGQRGYVVFYYSDEAQVTILAVRHMSEAGY